MDNQEHRFACDNCGSDMRFAPDAGHLVCNHCGSHQAMSAGDYRAPALTEIEFDPAIDGAPADQEFEELRLSSCPNCGAQVEFDAANHAAECPFCATPVVTDTGTHRQIKPRGVLPFVLTETLARQSMATWLGSLWFAPNGLQSYARKGRSMDGIYVPYWTFDADTKSRYRGERGTEYYETRTVTRNGKTEQKRVQKVRWRAASGRVARLFGDVLVLASKSLPKRFTDALEPWDLNELETYQPGYLAGFRAEGYTVTVNDGFVQARVLMDRRILRDVRSDIGGDRQKVHDVQTTVRDVTFKHVLLPVWLAAYKYRGQTYRFVVNGQTGRVQGERPYSIAKIAIAVIIGALLAGAVGFLLANQQ